MTNDAEDDPKRVVALVPVKDGAESIAKTVHVLCRSPRVNEVVVIDDGSGDDSAKLAHQAGARVVKLATNVGKAGAIAAGVQATPDAEVYLLVDADTGDSASGALALLPRVMRGEADMTIGVLPSAGGRGGFGVVKRFAAAGILSACGFKAEAPLSGQRAVKAELLRSLTLAPRFGLEVGMTIDAVRRGAKLVELPVEMDHRHWGRKLDGFAHRGRQGADIAQAFWPRVLSLQLRVSIAIAVALVVLGTVLGVSFENGRVDGKALPKIGEPPEIVLVPGATWPDVGSRAEGAVGSVVTGDVKDVTRAALAGSRDAKAAPDPSVRAIVVPSMSAAVARPGPKLIAGITTTADDAALRPLILDMNVNGTLISSSTRHLGLVDLTDLAPTVLSVANLPVPASMTGVALRLSGERTSPSTLGNIDKSTRFYGESQPRIILGYVLIQVLVYLSALALSRRGREFPLARFVAPAIAAVPLASYLVRWMSWGWLTSGFIWSALTALIVGIIVVMSGIAARGTTTALQRILLATIVFISLDVLTGAHLQVSGIFGSSPVLGTRYYGLGNPATAILLTAVVLWSAIHVQKAQHRTEAVWHVGAVFVILAAIVGAPGLGADVGGLLAVGIIGAMAVIGLMRGRIPWQWLAGAVAGGGSLLVIAAALDFARPADSRTHLGRLVDRVIHEGFGPLGQTISRKVDANVLGYGFPWSMAVLLIAGYVLYELRRRRWTGALPINSAMRVGAVLALVGGFILYVLNDSGIVVVALVAVYLGPFILVAYRLSKSNAAQLLEVSAS